MSKEVESVESRCGGVSCQFFFFSSRQRRRYAQRRSQCGRPGHDLKPSKRTPKPQQRNERRRILDNNKKTQTRPRPNPGRKTGGIGGDSTMAAQRMRGRISFVSNPKRGEEERSYSLLKHLVSSVSLSFLVFIIQPNGGHS